MYVLNTTNCKIAVVLQTTDSSTGSSDICGILHSATCVVCQCYAQRSCNAHLVCTPLLVLAIKT